jgi:hypothetical protein
MCAVCGYTADEFWASFAIDQNGPLSPPAVRAVRARCLSDWVRRATCAVTGREEHAERRPGEPLLRLPVDVEAADTGAGTSAGMLSGGCVKAGIRGYTVNSPTGAMRFCASLHTVVCHLKTRSPNLCHVLYCEWRPDYRKVDWAVWGAAWTWNAVMNDRLEPLPERLELADGRWMQFEPLDDAKVRVSLDAEAMAA